MADKDTFNAVATEYEVQIRGIHGEHTETNDGVFDISNRRRLGKSEKQLVQDMINGVKALMDKENSMWVISDSQWQMIKLNFDNDKEWQSFGYKK